MKVHVTWLNNIIIEICDIRHHKKINYKLVNFKSSYCIKQSLLISGDYIINILFS